jgi:hypothetical protein
VCPQTHTRRTGDSEVMREQQQSQVWLWLVAKQGPVAEKTIAVQPGIWRHRPLRFLLSYFFKLTLLVE